MKRRIVFSILIMGLIIGSFNSCDEGSLDPTLKQEKDINTSINTAEDLAGVLRGTYNRITSTFYYGRDYIIYAEVMSDNCFANTTSGRFQEPADMDIGPSVGYVGDTWDQIYAVISEANIILNKDKADIEGDAATIDNIFGQAYAIRALAYFDLLKLYGQQHVDGSDLGVPIVNEFASDISGFSAEDRHPTRASIDDVKSQIYEDFDNALSNLSSGSYPFASAGYQYIGEEAAHALRSRAALYFENWSQVISDCEAVINSGNYEIVGSDAYVDYWQKDGGPNSIWELAYNNTDNNNIDGLAYMYRGGSYGDAEVAQNLPSAFDSSDVRMTGELVQSNGDTVNMIGYGAFTPDKLRNNGKYPDIVNFADNVVMARYEEVILNYAEALAEAEQSGIDGDAVDYLNMIPANRGLGSDYYATASKDNILQERRRELCFEGFRYHDLVRTGRDIPSTDANDGYTHGEIPYGNFHLAFPIPQGEMESNKNIKQNEGY